MRFPSRAALALAAGALLIGFALGACGLGQNPQGENPSISDPVVAARVNGRPIYIEDVRRRAVQMGRLREGEDLDANSDAFFLTLDEMIEARLFAMEAETRGLDREADVRRQLDLARERVLADAIYEQLDERATDPATIERLYRENTGRLSQGQEIHLRHIQFETQEAAQAAKRRLDQGEAFEALAYTLSRDTATGADGGDLGFRAVGDLAPSVRQLVQTANVGQVVGPIQIGETWHLLRIDDLRERGAPSLETLRPRIIEWLRFKEISELRDRLETGVRIERLRQPDESNAPAGDVSAPADSPTPVNPPAGSSRPPVASARPGTSSAGGTSAGGAPPPFPFPMGPGGVYGNAPTTTTTTTTTAPAPTAQRPTATTTQRAPAPAPADPSAPVATGATTTTP